MRDVEGTGRPKCITTWKMDDLFLRTESHTSSRTECKVGKRLCILLPNVPPTTRIHQSQSQIQFQFHHQPIPYPTQSYHPISPPLSSLDHRQHLLLLATSVVTRTFASISVPVASSLRTRSESTRSHIAAAASLPSVNTTASPATHAPAGNPTCPPWMREASLDVMGRPPLLDVLELDLSPDMVWNVGLERRFEVLRFWKEVEVLQCEVSARSGCPLHCGSGCFLIAAQACCGRGLVSGGFAARGLLPGAFCAGFADMWGSWGHCC